MRLVIDGVVFDNPTFVRIEVDEEGETVGPWRVEIVGGKLTVVGDPALAVTCVSQLVLLGRALSAVNAGG